MTQTFADFYKALPRKKKGEIVKKLIMELDIAGSTVALKLGNNNFSKLEKEKIAEILQEPVHQLFPEKEEKFM